MGSAGDDGDIRTVDREYLDSLDRSPAPIAIYDDEREIVFANEAAADIAGATRTETLVGRSILEFVHAETADAAVRRIERVIDDREATTTEQVKVETLQGNVRHVEVTSHPVRYDGRPAAEILLNDVTDHVRHERALERERDRFATLFENLPTPVVHGVERDGEPIIKRVNPRFEEVFGYEQAEVVDQNLDDYTVPDDKREEARRLNERIVQEKRLRTEVERLTADGPRTFLLQVAMREDDPHEGYAIYVDVTEQRRRKRELQRERDRLDALFESIPEAVVLVRFEDGRPLVERVNSAFEDVFGYDQREAVGECLDDLVVPDQKRESAEDMNRRAQELAEIEREVRRESVDGLRDFLFRAVPFSTDRDTVESLGVYVDISDQKARERQLQQQNERLDRFASVVSHDLRNPLSVAVGQTELLQDGADADLDALSDALDRMDRILDDLLTLARQGKTVTDPERVDAMAVARRAWRTVETADADLTVASDGLKVLADPDRLQEVYENLFRNAVEHGSTGSQKSEISDDAVEHGSTSPASQARQDAVEHAGEDVSVTVGTTDDEPGFYVADDGPGIGTDDPQKVFDQGFSTAEHGTGFGLNIVKEIVQAHGWEVDVADDAEGARFEVTGVETV